MNPSVTVIIPNYNHAPFLEQRLKSVFSQTYQDFEVIILDDCSLDESKLIIEQYKEHPKVAHILFNEKNSGSPFKQWQKGIRLAQGKYIWIAESDDYCDEKFLQIALQELTESESDLFYCLSCQVSREGEMLNKLEWWYEDLNNRRWQNGYVNEASEEIRSYLTKKNTIVNASAVVFRKTDKLQAFISSILNYKYCGDWMFWLQYLSNSSKICYSIKTTNYFRAHSQTTRSKSQPGRNTEILLIYKWICDHYFRGQDDWTLLAYFTRVHINFYPRKHVFKNAENLIQELGLSLKVPKILFYKYRH